VAKVLPILALVYLGLLIFALVDIVNIDRRRVRHLPKGAWVVIALVPFAGPLLWIFLGRGSFGEPEPPRPVGSAGGPAAPDDDPDFLNRLRREQEQQERIRRLEERLAELDDDGKQE
jgi:hypothetical protein